jgi:hypothetical protein
LIAVAVSQIDGNPVVSDRLVNPALEIAHIEKIIALKNAARWYPVTHENAEDLATDVLVGGSVKHGSPMFERRVHYINQRCACRTVVAVLSQKLSPFAQLIASRHY